VLQSCAVFADELPGIINQYHSLAAAKHRNSRQFIKHFAEFDFVAVECRIRKFAIVACQHRRAKPRQRFVLQKGLIAEEDADRRDIRRLSPGEKIEGGKSIGHALEYMDSPDIIPGARRTRCSSICQFSSEPPISTY